MRKLQQHIVVTMCAALCMFGFVRQANAQPVFTIDSVSMAPDIKAVAQLPVLQLGQPVSYAARFSMFEGGYPLYTLEHDGGITIHAPSARINLAGQDPAELPCAGKLLGYIVMEARGLTVLVPAYDPATYGEPQTCAP